VYFSAKSWFLKYKSGLLHGYKMKIINLILGPFFQELVDEEKTGYFMQDSVTA